MALAARRRLGGQSRGQLLGADGQERRPNDRAQDSEGKETAETVPGQFRIERRHVDAVREEAFRRAQERGGGRVDVSEVVRGILDDWISKRGK